MKHNKYGLNRGDRYGRATGSSHAAGWTPGIEWEPGDEHILEPDTGWSGSRGVRMTFGADDDGSDDQLDKILSDMDKEDEFGRMYRHSGDKLEESDEADPDVIIGRSGNPGYRGARPFFGAEDRLRFKAGNLEYEGPQLGGIVLGLAGIALLYKVVSSAR